MPNIKSVFHAELGGVQFSSDSPWRPLIGEQLTEEVVIIINNTVSSCLLSVKSLFKYNLITNSVALATFLFFWRLSLGQN